MVNKKRVRRKLPSLLINGPMTNGREFREYRRYQRLIEKASRDSARAGYHLERMMDDLEDELEDIRRFLESGQF